MIPSAVHEAPRACARGIFNFFGGIRRSTYPPSLFELRRVRPTHSSQAHAGDFCVGGYKGIPALGGDS